MDPKLLQPPVPEYIIVSNKSKRFIFFVVQFDEAVPFDAIKVTGSFTEKKPGDTFLSTLQPLKGQRGSLDIEKSDKVALLSPLVFFTGYFENPDGSKTIFMMNKLVQGGQILTVKEKHVLSNWVTVGKDLRFITPFQVPKGALEYKALDENFLTVGQDTQPKVQVTNANQTLRTLQTIHSSGQSQHVTGKHYRFHIYNNSGIQELYIVLKQSSKTIDGSTQEHYTRYTFNNIPHIGYQPKELEGKVAYSFEAIPIFDKDDKQSAFVVYFQTVDCLLLEKVSDVKFREVGKITFKCNVHTADAKNNPYVFDFTAADKLQNGKEYSFEEINF